MDNRYQLYVQHKNEAFTIKLLTENILIGRDAECDVRLSADAVLPRHARLFRDPFGRWVLETVRAEAVVYVNDIQGEAFSLRPGDRVRIGPFSLRLVREVERSIIPPPPRWPAGMIVDDDTPTLTHEPDTNPEFTIARFKKLDKITNSLANLTDVGDLYIEACRQLGRSHNTIALVVKVPKIDVPLKAGTKIIAHSRTADHSESVPPPNIHISRTVLEAVRSKKTAVSASAGAEHTDVRLSLTDDLAPRIVLAAPVAETRTGLDILYVDQPAYIAPVDALGFFSVVARMVNLTRKTLIMAEERTERRLLDHQIETAKQIQSNLTPKELDLFDNVEVALHYKPALWVGGDYCDLCVSSDNRLVFAVGDVTGKGLPAAMVMANLQAMLRSILQFNTNPQIVLGKINDMLSNTLLDAMFITLLLGFLNPENGELEYVNAGHELPLLISRSGSVRQLGAPVNCPLGIQKGAFEVQRYLMSRGEGLLLVSDGITESISASAELFGVQNLIKTVSAASRQHPRSLVDTVVGAASEFRGQMPQSDDITVLALKWI